MASAAAGRRVNELDDLVASSHDCARERDEFNALAGTSIEDPLVFHFSGACSAEEFVRDVLAQRHVGEFARLKDDDLLDLVRSICAGARSDELSFWLAVLELNLPGVPISDLIFYPEQALRALGITDLASDDITPEDILRIARTVSLAEPIALGPSTRRGPSD